MTNTPAALPQPCGDCRRFHVRVAAATDDRQWDAVVGSHPHLRPPDPRAVCFQRCTACGCCWSISWQFEVGAVEAEQLPEAEFHHRIASLRSAPPMPFLDTRWGVVAVVYTPLLLVSSGLTALFARFATSEADGWAKGWPVIAMFAVVALAAGVGLVRVLRCR